MTDAAPPVAVLSYHGPADGPPPGRSRVWLAMGVAAVLVAVVTFAVAGVLTAVGVACGHEAVRDDGRGPIPAPQRPLTTAEVAAVLNQPAVATALTPAQADAFAARVRRPDQAFVRLPYGASGPGTVNVNRITGPPGGRVALAGHIGSAADYLWLDASGHVVKEHAYAYLPDGYVLTDTDGVGRTTTATYHRHAGGRTVRFAAGGVLTVAGVANLAVVLSVAAVGLLRRSPAAPAWCRRYAVWQVPAGVVAATALFAATAAHWPTDSIRGAGPTLYLVPLAVAAAGCLFPAVLWRTVGRRRV